MSRIKDKCPLLQSNAKQLLRVSLKISKIKKSHKRKMTTIDRLETLRGEGTSLVTLYIKKGASLGAFRTMMRSEYATAARIKSRV